MNSLNILPDCYLYYLRILLIKLSFYTKLQQGQSLTEHRTSTMPNVIHTSYIMSAKYMLRYALSLSISRPASTFEIGQNCIFQWRFNCSICDPSWLYWLHLKDERHSRFMLHALPATKPKHLLNYSPFPCLFTNYDRFRIEQFQLEWFYSRQND